MFSCMEMAMCSASGQSSEPVRQRLLNAARECFLADEYRAVTTRRIAEKAGANVSMIRYYFRCKEGLYEAMIRETLAPLLEVLDGELLESKAGFGEFLRLYYRTMTEHADFPRLILKVLALNRGPGKSFIKEYLERGRTGGARKVEALKASGQIPEWVDPDIVRIAFVSVAITPLLLKNVFEEQMGREMDASYLDALADFNGRLFAAGLSPAQGS